MELHTTFRAAAIAALTSVAAFGEAPTAPATLDRYLNTSQGSCRAADQAMEIDIQASLPKLQKQGTMHGLKVISDSGQVAYRFLRFTGDKLVKTDVIARFLTAESHPPEHLGDVGITQNNYKFHYKKLVENQGATAYVYDIKPRKKRLGLYKGELWLDAESATPVRESGEWVKSPSIFIKGVRFVRDYPEHMSCSQPARTSITVQTRIAGDAEMVVSQHPVASSWKPDTDSAEVSGQPDGGTH